MRSVAVTGFLTANAAAAATETSQVIPRPRRDFGSLAGYALPGNITWHDRGPEEACRVARSHSFSDLMHVHRLAVG